jgi:sorbitol/mannitol transport system substrate-binding protein
MCPLSVRAVVCSVLGSAVLAATSAQAQPIKVSAIDLAPYVSADRGEQGYLYEVVRQVFERAGHPLAVEFFPPARARKRVETGLADVLIPAYREPADEELFAYSEPIHGSQQITLMLAGESPPTAEELAAARSAPPGSTGSVVDLIDKIAARRLRLATADKLQAIDVLVNQRPHLIGKLTFTGAMATRDFHVAFSVKRRDHLALVDAFNRGLKALKDSGEYERILIRYGYLIQPAGKDTLNIGAVPNFDMGVMKELSAAFTQSRPGTRLRWYQLDENLLRRTLLASLALNENVFDVITIGNYDSPIYAQRGWLEPLNPPPGYNADDLLPAIRQGLSHGGQLHALPFYAETAMTYYRRDLFEKAGLSMPERPTWQALSAFARKLHDPANEVYGICLRGKPGWGENMALLSILVNAYGGDWFDGQQQPDLTSGAWQAAVRDYVELLTRYGPPQPHQNGYVESLKLFADGRCALWVDASVAASYLRSPATSKVSASVAFAPAPGSPQSQGTQWLWTWALAVPRSSKKALAREFVYWATSPEYIQLVAKKKGWLAVPPGTRHSTYSSEQYQKAAPFGRLVEKELAGATGGQFVAIPEFTALGTTVGIRISQVLQRKATVEGALQSAQTEAKRIMRHATSEGGGSKR